MSVFVNQNTDPTIDLTFENVVEYFEKNNVKSECPSCGNKSWTVNVSKKISGDTTLTTSLPFGTPNGDFFLGTRGLEVVSAVCKHCSFIRFHGKDQIKQWINSIDYTKENNA